LAYEQQEEEVPEKALKPAEENGSSKPQTPQKPEPVRRSSDAEQTPRVRSKKYANRVANLHLQQSLGPPNLDIDIDSVTPKANAFDQKEASPTQTLTRPRARSMRSESDAEKGDDEEGYDDILSGY